MERKNKKIVAGMMAGFCVLSSQILVQYGLLVGNGGIATKNSSNLQAFGISNEKKSDASGEENEDKAPNNKYKDGKKRGIELQYLLINGYLQIINPYFSYNVDDVDYDADYDADYDVDSIPGIKKQKLDDLKDIDGASGKNALKMEDEDDRKTYIPDIKK